MLFVVPGQCRIPTRPREVKKIPRPTPVVAVAAPVTNAETGFGIPDDAMPDSSPAPPEAKSYPLDNDEPFDRYGDGPSAILGSNRAGSPRRGATVCENWWRAHGPLRAPEGVYGAPVLDADSGDAPSTGSLGESGAVAVVDR